MTPTLDTHAPPALTPQQRIQALRDRQEAEHARRGAAKQAREAHRLAAEAACSALADDLAGLDGLEIARNGRPGVCRVEAPRGKDAPFVAVRHQLHSGSFYAGCDVIRFETVPGVGAGPVAPFWHDGVPHTHAEALAAAVAAVERLAWPQAEADEAPPF